MAKSKTGIDFDGFLDYARQLDELGDEYLKQATENALTKSKAIAQGYVVDAMQKSKYAFKAGEQSNTKNGVRNRPASGKAWESALKVAKQPVEWDGTVATAHVGVDLKEAPEVAILASGTPHIAADRDLANAIRVKGKVKKAVMQAQQAEFEKVIEEAMKQ